MYKRELVYRDHAGFRVGVGFDGGCRQSSQASTSRTTTTISASTSQHILIAVLKPFCKAVIGIVAEVEVGTEQYS